MKIDDAHARRVSDVVAWLALAARFAASASIFPSSPLPNARAAARGNAGRSRAAGAAASSTVTAVPSDTARCGCGCGDSSSMFVRHSFPAHTQPRVLAARGDKSIVAMPGIDGDAYVVTPEQIEAFERDGYVHLPNVLTEDEMREVEEPAMRFIRGEVVPEGKDLCDMSGATDRTPDEYTVFNAMLPRRYLPSMRGNIFERRTASIATQLQRGKNMAIDYDQLLAKRPSTSDSIFAWHQDMAYWPPLEEDPSTCTCWIAIDDSTVENGCMRFLPGSGMEKELRAHAPVKLKGGDRADDESSHALCTTLTAEDETRVRLVPDQARGHHRARPARRPRQRPERERWVAARVRAGVPDRRDGGRGAAARLLALAQRRLQLGRVSRLARRGVIGDAEMRRLLELATTLATVLLLLT